MFDEDPGSVGAGQPHRVMKYIRAWKPTFIYVSTHRVLLRAHTDGIVVQKEFVPQMEQYGVYVPGTVGGYFRDVRAWKQV